MPNPGDLLMITCSLWALACLFLVLQGDEMFAQLARSSRLMSTILEDNDAALFIIMAVGFVTIVATLLFFYKTNRLLLFLAVVTWTLAPIVWQPMHQAAFVVKYLTVLFFATFGGLWVYQNFWKMTDLSYRLLMIWLGWVCAVTFYQNGVSFNILIMMAFQFLTIFGVAVAWGNRFLTREQITQYGIVLSYAGVFLCCFHIFTPLVVAETFVGGRYFGAFSTATAFASFLSVVVLALIWHGMLEKRITVGRIVNVFALIGIGLIFLSGTRSVSAAMIICAIALTYVFRVKIMVYLVFIGIIVLSLQLMFADSELITKIGERLTQVDENNRAGIWLRYFEAVLERPIFGWGANGQVRALYGDFLARYDFAAPGTHNALLGTAVRFGLIGLLSHLSLFIYAAVVGSRVIFSKIVPIEDKKVYALPIVMVLLVFLEGMFEDNLSPLRGSIIQLAFYPAYIFSTVWGMRLLETARENVVRDNLVGELKAS